MSISKAELEVRRTRATEINQQEWLVILAMLCFPPLMFFLLKKLLYGFLSLLLILISLIIANIYSSLGNWPFPNWLFPTQIVIHAGSAIYIYQQFLNGRLNSLNRVTRYLWGFSFAFCIAVYAFTSSVLVSQYAIASVSMSPSLIHGDTVVVQNSLDKTASSWLKLFAATNFTYGDIVIVKHPDKDEVNVKRIVANEGDEIEFMGNSLKINGTEVERQLIDSPRKNESFRWLKNDAYNEYNNGNRYIVHISEDPAPVKGKMIIPKGYVFVMGDNRSQSLDSRFWGLLPKENILGKPLFIWWSIQPGVKPWIRWNRIVSWVA